ncbi:acyltransferase family protein [Woodsholea maritima]|uniref:acyltransferase family protein n=1 Tax=Woodsholea maritima TaxID=240237 RepID=UPI000360283C|nr:acyltransferase family protein [Woodsholea maritima]
MTHPTPNPNLPTLDHRAYLDGLRAWAIVPVVLFHAFPDYVSGGFIGVDVFFVISGFLITQILLKQADQGRLSYWSFLTKRVRRLWASFALIAFVTTAFAWIAYSPARLMDQILALVSAFGLSSNWYFFATSDYFNPQLHNHLLLHTWSLGVEEQFYLFYPLVIVGVARLKWPLGLSLAAVWLLSLSLSLYDALAGHFEGSFFATHLRAWELLSGALLGLAAHRGLIARAFANFKDHPLFQGLILNSLAGVGLMLIVVSSFAYNEQMRFPGYGAVLPVLGCGLVLIAGELFHLWNTKSLVLNLTCLPSPARYIGRVSYSWYLWHWPILVMLGSLIYDPTDTEILIAVILSFALACAAFHGVEQPIRLRRILADQVHLLVSAAVTTSLFLGLSLMVIEGQGLPQRIPVEARDALATGPDPRGADKICLSAGDFSIRHNLPRPQGDLAQMEVCALGRDHDQALDFILWGDSHAGALEGAILAEAHRRAIFGASLTLGACPPVLGGGWSGLSPQSLHACARHNDNAARLITLWQPRTTLMVGHWDVYARRPDMKPGKFRKSPSQLTSAIPAQIATDDFGRTMESAIRTVSASTQIHVLLDVPTHDFSVPEAVSFQAIWPWLPAPAWISRDDQILKRSQYVPLFENLAQEGLIAVDDPLDTFCPDTHCLGANQGQPLFYDAYHLNDKGGDLVITALPHLLPYPVKPADLTTEPIAEP